jgi:hypothetical protein
MVAWALYDSDFPVHKTVIKDNAHVGFDQILVDWMNCNLRDLHA